MNLYLILWLNNFMMLSLAMVLLDEVSVLLYLLMDSNLCYFWWGFMNKNKDLHKKYG